MKYLGIRDLRNEPGKVRETLTREDVVLTSNGRPYAVLLGVDEESVEETLRLVDQLRAELALRRMRKAAQESGGASLTAAEIKAEVAAARRERSAG